MPQFIQGLGKLDAQLVFQDRRAAALTRQERETIEASIALTDRFLRSVLWVLGMYEIIRSIDERARNSKPTPIGVRLATKVRKTKWMFERVRMPLAKFEPPTRFPDDEGLARASLHRVDGIAWRVKEKVFVSRWQLSEAAMALFDRLEKDRIKKEQRNARKRFKLKKAASRENRNEASHGSRNP